MLLLFKYRNENTCPIPYQASKYTALGLYVLGWILGVYFGTYYSIYTFISLWYHWLTGYTDEGYWTTYIHVSMAQKCSQNDFKQARVPRIKLNQMMREGSISDVYLSTLDAIKGCDFSICDSKRKFVENTRTNYTMRSFIFSLNQQTWKSNLPGHSLMIELAETLFILGFRCSWALHWISQTLLIQGPTASLCHGAIRVLNTTRADNDGAMYCL